ncbi:cytochrome P450 [Earliella scabrosa]|nr:cytochrome P450 [Earliella scabrosa]
MVDNGPQPLHVTRLNRQRRNEKNMRRLPAPNCHQTLRFPAWTPSPRVRGSTRRSSAPGRLRTLHAESPWDSTFILAGMDTTSNALSRILALLAEHPSVQDKFRSELLEATHGGATDPDYDELMKLLYLDVACEKRCDSTLLGADAIDSAAKDEVLPLSHPVRGRDGTSNNNKELWGEDANEWKPERWLAQLPAALEDAHRPSVYSNFGFKFSELEMKVYLSVLLTRFAFELTDQTIAWNSSSINYPTMGEESTKPEMLLKVRML